MMTKKILPYIDGLKGIACIGVMVGHFFSIFRYMESAGFAYEWISNLIASPIGVILDASFWLYLFFVCSGFLLARARVESIRDLILLCVKRFLRLSLPILFSSAAVYLLLALFGNSNRATAEFFECSWYQNNYVDPVSLVSVLTSPIDVLLRGNTSINSPFWVLKDMLRVSVVIYITLFLMAKTKAYPYAKYLIFYVGLALMFTQSFVKVSCYLGMGIMLHQDLIRKIVLKVGKFCWIPILLIYLAYGLQPRIAFSLLFFVCVVAVTPYFPYVSRALGSKFPCWLNRIGFGVYALHWPILCTAVGFVLLKMIPRFGYPVSFVTGFIVYFVMSLILGWVFSKTAEPAANNLTKYISNKLSLIFKQPSAQ